MAIEPVASPNLDLKWSLTLRVVAVALVCFLVAAALALFGTYRDVRQANENVADIVVRQLQNQLFRIEADIDLRRAVPRVGPGNRARPKRRAVHPIHQAGRQHRAIELRRRRSGERRSAGLVFLAGRVAARRAAPSRAARFLSRQDSRNARRHDGDGRACWPRSGRTFRGLLGLTALVVGAICLLQYVAISRALRPTRDILVGLDRLARGDLSCRLPSFRLIELQRISEVFNTLAASLDRTTRERTALAARLVDGQEQERRHLARELHDELAQTLSAISAAAASIKATAETECPALVSEANNLSQTSMAVMRSLRTTLQTLRPPEIDDFGLAASLAALAREQERRAGGKLEIQLEVDGDLHGLPPTAASHVYRIVQEGLTNIGKHAQCKPGARRFRLLSRAAARSLRPGGAGWR